MINNQNKFTEADEVLAKALASDHQLSMTVLKFIQKIDPAMSETDADALDMFAYGIALKLTTLDRFRHSVDELNK